VRSSRAKATAAAVTSTDLLSAVAIPPSDASLPASGPLKSPLIDHGDDMGTDSDEDDEDEEKVTHRFRERDKTAKVTAGSGGRERDRKRERDRRRERENHAAATSNKPKADKVDFAAVATTATAASTSSTATGGSSSTAVSAKRKPSSTTASSHSALASAAHSKPKQSSKQQRAVSEAESPEGELYCVCRLPNTGEAMICCEECEEWYHFRCIGMTAAEAARTDHYVCAACREKALGKRSASGGVKEGEGKKRRRDEEAGKVGAARVNGLDAEVEGKRSRRHRNGGGEEREEDMGDGTGKWLKKDMVVDSESDDEQYVYMTSDDDDQPQQQQAAMAIKSEQTNLKQEDAATLVTPSSYPASSSFTSSTAHRLPRISSSSVSFDRPDYRLHPLIHQTSPRAHRHDRSSSPTRVVVGSLAVECATAVRSVVQHRWLAVVQEPERQCEAYILRQVNRCVQRWQAVLEEYEEEETKRQMQLSAEEWRWRRLVHHYLNHELDSIAQSDDGVRPPPTSFELLLSSALPIGLGHPRFIHDTQEVVNAAHEKSLQLEAASSFQSQATTPASYAVPSVSTTSSSTSRLTFHFHRVKRDAADYVSMDSLWCVGCAGYIPVDEYATHIRDCCETAVTTPDQKLVVVVPYEQPMPEPMVVEMDAPVELAKLDVLGELEDAEAMGKRAELDEAADKADAVKYGLGDKPDVKVLTMARFHQQLAERRALSLQYDIRQHSSDPSGRFPLREYLNKPAPEPKPAEPAKPAPPPASPQLPPAHLSIAPAPHLITRHQRFLNPVLFPTMLCGYPLLSSSKEAAGHFCSHLHSSCSAHSGWEERWSEERRATRVKLEGRLRAVKADTEGIKRVLDVEEKERVAGKSALHNTNQLVTGALSGYLDAERAEGAHEASPAASELSDGSAQSMEEETALEAHTLLRRPASHRADSSSEASSDGEEAIEANGMAVPGGEKKRTDRERLRERERINKQRQRERAKAREREKELRMREKERSREKKREKRKRKEKERERKERRRDKDRHGHKSKKKSSRSSGVRRRDESSSSDRSSNSSDDRSDDSSRTSLSDGRDY